MCLAHSRHPRSQPPYALLKQLLRGFKPSPWQSGGPAGYPAPKPHARGIAAYATASSSHALSASSRQRAHVPPSQLRFSARSHAVTPRPYRPSGLAGSPTSPRLAPRLAIWCIVFPRGATPVPLTMLPYLGRAGGSCHRAGGLAHAGLPSGHPPVLAGATAGRFSEALRRTPCAESLLPVPHLTSSYRTFSALNGGHAVVVWNLV